MSADRHASASLTRFAPRTGANDTRPGIEQHNGSNDAPQTPTKSQRRRRLSRTEEQPSQDRIFFFVDSNSSSREKRAYVMRHHVQEKRRQRKQLLSHSPDDGRNNRPLRYLPWRQKPHGQENGDGSDATQGIATETISNGNPPVPVGLAVPKPTICPSNRPYPTPLTMLDSARGDPFNSLPVVCSKDDYELIDYWTNKLTYWSGQNKYIKDQIFRTAMVHPLAFQAVVLGYCSRWRARMYNLRDSREIRTHVGQSTMSIEMARKGLLNIDGDNLAMALTGLSLQEERFGDQQRAKEYADQAVQILRPRAGPNTGVQVFLHYVRCVAMPQRPTIDRVGQQWLLTFLRGAEEMMLKHKSDTYLSSVPQRGEAFHMESPLFPLLSSGPRPSQVPQTSRLYVVRDGPSQEVCRTAALIYITAALWDFQDSPSKTSRFLAHISAVVRQHKLDRYPACETLVWLLLEEGYESDMKDAERTWSTSELLKTHKQLRSDLQFQFNEILLSFLMLTPPIRGIDAFERELDAMIPEILDDV